MEGWGVKADPFPKDLDYEPLSQLSSSRVKLDVTKLSTEQISAAGLMGTLSGPSGEVVTPEPNLDTCNANFALVACCICIIL